ncbi:phosphatidylserine synthase 2-like [Clytia hemisphaerica]|uniref:Phosphatidylserine synthase n=1 Tax=Clytia hemisphaerica TaxID=252671 RepID=A0A7M5VEP2_9CNID|eukprot:TCONS_00011359-protein
MKEEKGTVGSRQSIHHKNGGHSNGTNDEPVSFFWKSHTISVLTTLLLLLCYLTFLEDQSEHSSEYNAKRGVLACIMVFLAFGVTQAKDGPFLRPHPVLWRFILCCSVIYELCLIFLLFQTAKDARRWMSHFDPKLGVQLPEHDYGGSCLLYDENNTENPWHNFWDKIDGFVPAHLFGWWIKTLILRDYWLTFLLSILFEILEYSLQHQLPNFSECWWDHWILDFIICNGGGILLGMFTLQHLEMKKYHWRSLWSIPTYSGKFYRFMGQFTPYSWRKFSWCATYSLKRWLAVLGLIVMFSLCELNVFYLKTALWIPPEHYTVLGRLLFVSFLGLVSIRECYDYLNDSACKKFGQQSWIFCLIIITESLIAVKFLWTTVTLPPPQHIIILWTCIAIGLVLYTCWLFVPNLFRTIRAQLSNDETNIKTKVH